MVPSLTFPVPIDQWEPVDAGNAGCIDAFITTLSATTVRCRNLRGPNAGGRCVVRQTNSRKRPSIVFSSWLCLRAHVPRPVACALVAPGRRLALPRRFFSPSSSCRARSNPAASSQNDGRHSRTTRAACHVGCRWRGCGHAIVATEVDDHKCQCTCTQTIPRFPPVLGERRTGSSQVQRTTELADEREPTLPVG